MNRIQELRNKRGLTLKGLSKEIGLRDSTLSQYETGKVVPRIAYAQKLATFFDVSINYLLGMESSSEDDKKHDSSMLIRNKIVNSLETELSKANNLLELMNDEIVDLNMHKMRVDNAKSLQEKNNAQLALNKSIYKHLKYLEALQLMISDQVKLAQKNTARLV